MQKEMRDRLEYKESVDGGDLNRGVVWRGEWCRCKCRGW